MELINSLNNNSKIAKVYRVFSICIVMVLAVFWCMQKNGMFLDEIYSYGLSNGYYEPFLKEAKQGNIIDSTFLREEFIDYLTVSEEDSFSYDSVFYNQEKDVHPPLFYVLLHTVASIFPNTFSKWMGLGLNLFYFFITLLFVNGISKQLFHNRYIPSIMTILYGCTSYALSNVVFIRMYMLSTMLTVVLAFLVLKVLNDDLWVYYVLMCIVVCAGLLTHYFFVFYAFFISAFLVIYLLFKKDYTKAIKSSVFLILGVIAFIAIFPTCLHHITVKTGTGATTAEYISSFSLRRIFAVAYGLAADYIFPIIVGILILFFLLINRKKAVSVILTNRSTLPAFIILVCPAILSFFAITLVSSSSRYVANISPFFVFIVGYFIDVSIAITEKESYRKVGLALLTIIPICFAFIIKPSYLYTEYAEYDQMVQEYSKYSCIYITTNRNPSITQDLPQLIHFDNVIVVEDVDSPYLANNVKNVQEDDGLIVYFASYPESLFDESKVAKIKDKTGFSSGDFMYSNGWSNVYRFTKGD